METGTVEFRYPHGHMRIVMDIVGQQSASKTGQMLQNGGSDFARSQHRHGAVGQFHA